MKNERDGERIWVRSSLSKFHRADQNDKDRSRGRRDEFSKHSTHGWLWTFKEEKKEAFYREIVHVLQCEEMTND